MHVPKLRCHKLHRVLFLGILTMRYLLHKSQRDEIAGRQLYLYDVFHMYFLPGNPEGGFIPLTPLGPNDTDILFLTGHTDCVENYLQNTIGSTPEKTIVITSCMGKLFKKYTSKKVIYIPDLQQPLCLLRDGKPYGFDFNISDAELDFYNASGTIMDRVNSAYVRL